MHDKMMEYMNICASELSGKTMDANAMNEMHNCMVKNRMAVE